MAWQDPVAFSDAIATDGNCDLNSMDLKSANSDEQPVQGDKEQRDSMVNAPFVRVDGCLLEGL
jgi:hypothetical protein